MISILKILSYSHGNNYLNSLLIPITPHATLGPEFPVVLLNGWSVYPRSSSWACTTQLLPKTENSPHNFT